MADREDKRTARKQAAYEEYQQWQEVSKPHWNHRVQIKNTVFQRCFYFIHVWWGVMGEVRTAMMSGIV